MASPQSATILVTSPGADNETFLTPPQTPTPSFYHFSKHSQVSSSTASNMSQPAGSIAVAPTPPNTAYPSDQAQRPSSSSSLSRKGSRPASLSLEDEHVQFMFKQGLPIVDSDLSPQPQGTKSSNNTPDTATVQNMTNHGTSSSALSPATLMTTKAATADTKSSTNNNTLPPTTQQSIGVPQPTMTNPTDGTQAPTSRAFSPNNPLAKLQSSPSSWVDLKSPCFVHSHLDKGASLADWLSLRGNNKSGLKMTNQQQSDPTNWQSNQHFSSSSDSGYVASSGSEESSPGMAYEDDDDDGVSSLTKQLAETANGVREMSRQLGRARVKSNIQNVLIITKARDNRLIKLTRELAVYLMTKPRYNGRGLVVYVDNQLRTSKRFDAEGIEREYPDLFLPAPRRRSSASSLSSISSSFDSKFSSYDNATKEEGQLRYWTSDMCSRNPHWFDLVVTLGGDGTVLFASWLFQRIVPPVLPFALGSLGFLTPFDFADHAPVMDAAIDAGIRVSLRMRFTCTVYRAVAPQDDRSKRRAVKKAETGEIMMRVEKGGWEALESGLSGGAAPAPCGGKDKEVMCFTTRPVETFEVLNDLVVDRGPSPYVSLLELFADEHHLTTVQADGLTVSTPTGSTAYSLSAGGSLVHPEIPSILLTPICPHTLSFRPMLLPDSMELRICVPYNSRSTAWASFDGRGRVELKQGDHIKVTASRYPFPTVCADRQSTDWFQSISRTLKWNERERQKSFVVVEEGPAKARAKRSRPLDGLHKAINDDVIEEDENEDLDEEDAEEEEEEEETYDIDVSSPTSSTDNKTNDNGPTIAEEQRAMRKAAENSSLQRTPSEGLDRVTAAALRRAGIFDSHYSSSGVESPERFGQPHPHPPAVSPRHVGGLSNGVASGMSNLDLGEARMTNTPRSQRHGRHAEHNMQDLGEEGDRDHIHNPRSTLAGARSRIPRDRDFEAEMKTPRPTHAIARYPGDPYRGHGRTRSLSHDVGLGHRRAFALWGHDESDPSDSDNN